MEPSKKPRKDNAKNEFDAIVPDENAGTDADVFATMDQYQKKIQSEWETAKKAYQEKIDDLMDGFVKEQASAQAAAEDRLEKIQKSGVKNTAKPSSPEVEEFMSELRKSIQEATKKKPRYSLIDTGRSQIINVRWNPIVQHSRKIVTGVAAAFLIGLAALLVMSKFLWVQDSTALPYSHTSSLLIENEKVFVVDWFRRALYVHRKQAGLPILSVETVPNEFTTGFVFTNSNAYSVDGFSKKLIEHTPTRDHRVLRSIPTPGPEPSGLFWDGQDLWMFDNTEETLYRLHGRDVEDVVAEFTAPGLSVTAFRIINKRVWVLDGQNRQVFVFRLQDPLKQLAMFDLDPFLNESIPTGFHVEEDKIWLLTEEPALLMQIPRKKLEKSSVEKF